MNGKLFRLFILKQNANCNFTHDFDTLDEQYQSIDSKKEIIFEELVVYLIFFCLFKLI